MLKNIVFMLAIPVLIVIAFLLLTCDWLTRRKRIVVAVAFALACLLVASSGSRYHYSPLQRLFIARGGAQTTTTIGNLPTNATPNPLYYTIVDDGNSNTWKSTLQSIINQTIGFPVPIPSGGTGVTAWTANSFLTASGLAQASFVPIPLPTGQGGTGNTTGTITTAQINPQPSFVPGTCISITGTPPWNPTFAVSGANCTAGPTPTPAPTNTCANANCTTSGSNAQVITVVTPTPAPAQTVYAEMAFAMPQTTPAAGTTSVPVHIPSNWKNVQYVGSYCQYATAGTGGSALAWTWIWQSGANRSGTATTAAPIPTTSWSSTTSNAGGAPASPTPVPTDTTTPVPQTWIWVYLNVVPSTAPYGNGSCFMEISHT